MALRACCPVHSIRSKCRLNLVQAPHIEQPPELRTQRNRSNPIVLYKNKRENWKFAVKRVSKQVGQLLTSRNITHICILTHSAAPKSSAFPYPPALTNAAVTSATSNTKMQAAKKITWGSVLVAGHGLLPTAANGSPVSRAMMAATRRSQS